MILNQFEKHIKQTDRSPSVKYYLSDLRKFTRWLSRDITSASKFDLIEYRKYLRNFGGRNNTKAKASTVYRSLLSLSIFFKWALDQKLIQTDPTKGLKPVKAKTPSSEWLSRKEQMKFMSVVQGGQNLRDIAICSLMLYAGLRVSEVCALKPDDLVLKKGSGHVIVRTGKGCKQRIVPLNSTLRNILSSYIEQNGTILFESNKGGGLTPRGIQYMVKRYAYLAKLENVTPRVLCNSFCKNLIDIGVDLEKVAALAGHLSPNTIKKYIMPDTDYSQGAENSLDLIFY